MPETYNRYPTRAYTQHVLLYLCKQQCHLPLEGGVIGTTAQQLMKFVIYKSVLKFMYIAYPANTKRVKISSITQFSPFSNRRFVNYQKHVFLFFLVQKQTVHTLFEIACMTLFPYDKT